MDLHSQKDCIAMGQLFLVRLSLGHVSGVDAGIIVDYNDAQLKQKVRITVRRPGRALEKTLGSVVH